MNRTRLTALALVATAIAFALGPFFTDFNGFDPALYPIPQDSPPAQPAGYAFAIWGVIYAALIGATAWGLLRHAQDPLWKAHRVPLLISLGIGVIWLPVAEVSPIWATILIWAMLVSALAALARAPGDSIWSLRLAVGLYAGWLTAASSVSVALVGAGWGIAFGQEAWAIFAVALALVIAALTMFALSDAPAYPAAVTWGLVGIAVHNIGTNTTLTALAAIAALFVIALAFGIRHKTAQT